MVFNFYFLSFTPKNVYNQKFIEIVANYCNSLTLFRTISCIISIALISLISDRSHIKIFNKFQSTLNCLHLLVSCTILNHSAASCFVMVHVCELYVRAGRMHWKKSLTFQTSRYHQIIKIVVYLLMRRIKSLKNS